MTERRSGDEIVDAMATALRRRVGEERRARERLASFVFRDGDGDGGDGAGEPGPAPGSAWNVSSVPEAEPPTAWSVHLARVLRAVADPPTLELLESLREGPRPFAEATGGGRAGGDRLAAATWLGDLAATGLVSHELATDRVALTPLGEAIVDLVDEVIARAGQGGPTGSPTSGDPARAAR